MLNRGEEICVVICRQTDGNDESAPAMADDDDDNNSNNNIY